MNELEGAANAARVVERLDEIRAELGDIASGNVTGEARGCLLAAKRELAMAADLLEEASRV